MEHPSPSGATTKLGPGQELPDDLIGDVGLGKCGKRLFDVSQALDEAGALGAALDVPAHAGLIRQAAFEGDTVSNVLTALSHDRFPVRLS